MPWYGFTKYGVPDIPNPVSTVFTGQIFLYPSTGAQNSTKTAYVTGPPIGFLRCDGTNVKIIDYQDLYDFFVTNLGSGAYFGAAPVNYFKLPNMSSNFSIGLNTADADVNLIGKTGGAASHTHTVAGSHTHPTIAHDHTVEAHTHSYGNHTHKPQAHTHGKGTLGIIPNSQDNPLFTPPPSITVAKYNHDHAVSAAGSPSGSATSSNPTSLSPVTNPRTSNGNSAVDNTLGINGTAPTTSALNNTAGNESSTIALNSSGSVDSIPQYYSMYYIIKV
jgi:microcystin-dependent protein